jgi:hypothetical protein
LAVGFPEEEEAVARLALPLRAGGIASTVKALRLACFQQRQREGGRERERDQR